LLLTPVRALLLALALLLAQAAGLGHRVAHAGAIASGGGLAAWRAAGVQTAQGVAASDHPAGSTECRLIDQLAHADAVCGGEPAALPVVLARADRLAAARPTACAASPTAYLARAPPCA
jgi:hypothetical protein